MKGHDLVYSVSMTTRKPRENEVHGREYYFVSREKFEDCIRAENARVCGVCQQLLRDSLEPVQELLNAGKEVVLEIEVRERPGPGKMKDAVLIFIAPPSMDALYERLTSRDGTARNNPATD